MNIFKKNISPFLIVISGILWGCSGIFVNYLTNVVHLSSLQRTAIRMTLAALILNAVLIIKSKGFKAYRISRKALVISLVAGVVSVLAMSVFYYTCMVQTSVAVSAVLLYTSPIFVMIMSVIFFKEKLTVSKIFSFVFAIAGCALVSGIASGASISSIGIVFGLLSGFTYSLYGIFSAFFLKENDDPLVFTSIGALVISKPWEIPALAAATPSLPLTLFMFVMTAVCLSVLPFLLYTEGLKGVAPSTASILAFIDPLTNCLLGALVLRQPIDVFGVIGIACVCAAIVILNVRPVKKR